MNKIILIIIVTLIVIVGGYFLLREEPTILEGVTPLPTPPAVQEFAVSGTEYSFNPSSITVVAGNQVKITFRNTGRLVHNFVVRDLAVSTRTISPGQTDTVEFTAPVSGTYTFICSVPGHSIAGMLGDLEVE